MLTRGQIVGGYRVLSLLAEGGMGAVYRVESLLDRRLAALKILHESIRFQRKDMGRFLREAVIAQRLHHPNLVEFYRFGFDLEYGFFLITELLQGQELEERLRERGTQPLPLKDAFDIALQICAGLEAAHSAGIIHRDLKPANLFVCRHADGFEVIKIFDFGIGKLLDEEVGGKLTMTGVSIGTPLYMAPEQIRGPVTSIGPATDIYALGVIFYQLLTGKLPFTGDHPYAIMSAHLKEEAPLLRKARRELAGSDLEALLAEMLAKETIDRPASLSLVRERLWEARQLLTPDSASQTTVLEIPELSKLFALSGLHTLSPYALQEIQQTKPPLDDPAEGLPPTPQTDAWGRSSSPPASPASPFSSSAPPQLAATAPPPASQQALGVLLLREGEQMREIAWLFPGERITLGASKHLAVSLPRAGLAPEHAEIACSIAGWITLSSLGQALIRVNGSAVTSSLLQDGDWMTLGQAEIRLACFPAQRPSSPQRLSKP